jgi:hypothetical protein
LVPGYEPKNSNVFFDMFLVDYNGDLIDVPVRVRNLVGQNSDKSNADDSKIDQWILTRRFFLYDTLSGVEEDELKVVRYAKNITLKFKLDKENIEQIYPPYLEIAYEEKSAEDIRKSDTNSQKEVMFLSSYSMDTEELWGQISTVLIILISIASFLTFVFMVIYCRSEKLEVQETDTFMSGIKFLEYGVQFFSNILFWFMFGVTGWIFVFFKL